MSFPKVVQKIAWRAERDSFLTGEIKRSNLGKNLVFFSFRKRWYPNKSNLINYKKKTQKNQKKTNNNMQFCLFKVEQRELFEERCSLRREL